MVLLIPVCFPPWQPVPARLGAGLVVVSGVLFSECVRLLIIYMFLGQDTEHRHSLSVLCHMQQPYLQCL